MAIMNGIVVEKHGEWFDWKVGLESWSFRQWPMEALTVDGRSLTAEAKQAHLKLVGEAVIFSIGYHAGYRRAKYQTLDDILLT